MVGKTMYERKKKWFEIVRNFTKETTFHGVKYIGEDTRFMSRRIAWIIVVVSVIIIFTYAIANRLVHFYKYPSNIEVEVGYLDRVPFPTVTMCNQNPYRLAALQRYGVYDITTYIYDSQKHHTSEAQECQETYLFNPLVCTIPPNAIFVRSFVETTASVCQRLCSDLLEAEMCSGFLYDATTRTCTLTSFTGEDEKWFTQEEANVRQTNCINSRRHFYRKQRCIDNSRIYCTFEDDAGDSQSRCRFATLGSEAETWQRVTASYPDVTYNSTMGHYLLFRDTKAAAGKTAQMETTNYINTTGRCIFLFVSMLTQNETYGGDGTFRVRLKKESLMTTEEAIINGTEIFGEDVVLGQQWLRLYHTFPDGVHKVILEAKQSEEANSFMLDDIEITHCEEMKRECIQSVVGLEYIGTKSVSVSGRQCLPWTDIIHEFNLPDQEEALMTILFPDSSIDTLENHCRYINIEGIAFPSCFTSTSNGYWNLEPCDIDRCACNEEEEFTCGDGICIPLSKTCDNERNCDDWSDESSVCESKITISCGFDDKYICGYRQLNNHDQLTWEKTDYDIYYETSLHLTTWPSTVKGETAIILSQPENFSKNKKLTIKMQTLTYLSDNGILVWLEGTYGFSRVPVMQQGVDVTTNGMDDFSDITNCEKSRDGLVKCSFCVPGGEGMVHRLVIAAIYQTADDFNIHEIQLSEENCTLSEEDFNTVFPTEASVSTDFNLGEHPYVQLADSIYMQWIFVSHDTVQKSASLLGENVVSNQDCDLCLAYKGDHYNYVYFDSIGNIHTSGYPYQYSNFRNSAWLIEMLEGERIKLTFLDFAVEDHWSCGYDSLTVTDPTNDKKMVHCGYKIPEPYESEGNTLIIRFSSDYIVTAKGVSMQYERISDEPPDYALALLYNGTFSEVEYSSRLITPEIRSIGDHCFSFEYINNNIVNVYLVVAEGTATLLFEDSYIGLSDWRKAYITVNTDTPGSHLVIHGIKSTDSRLQYIVVLDNVLLQHSRCENLDMPGISNVNCNFEDINQCGYTEQGVPSGQWVRSLLEEENNYGIHFIQELNRIPSVLVSPRWEPMSEGCIKLHVKSFNFSHEVCINVTLFDENAIKTTKELTCLEAISPKTVEVDVSKTTNRFGITAISSSKDNALDLVISEIELTQSECLKPTDLRETEEPPDVSPTVGHTITSSPVSTVEPTGQPNYQGSVVSVDSMKTYTITNKKHVTSFYLDHDEAFDLLLASQDVDLEHFIKNISHVKENFLLSCSWDGLPCDEDYTTEIMTDMGYCVSFNSLKMQNTKILFSERPGSEYGLRLTLNIEDFEHVEGIGTDSGIKIHFAASNEIPTMRSMGYAVSPGTHALFSLKYTSSTFLEPEYGTCGEKELRHYIHDNYTTSHCVTECSIKALQHQCDCLVPYMPRFNNSELCSLEDYLQCVVQQGHASRDSCDCPDACNQTSYDVQLSHSALSGLARHSILGEKEEKAKQDFHDTMDLQHRVNSVNYLDILSKIKGVLNAITEFKNFIGRETEQKLSFFENGIQSITEMAHNDLDTTLSQISEHETVYSTYMKDERDTYVKAFEKLSSTLQSFATAFKLEHPCRQDLGSYAKTFSSMLQTDLQDTLHMISSYNLLYGTNVLSGLNCTVPHFAIFPDYVCAGFPWVHDKVIPQKAVIEEKKYLRCKAFTGSTLANFIKDINYAMEMYNVYTSFHRDQACQMAKDAIQETTATTASSGVSSGGGSGAYSYTPYMSSNSSSGNQTTTTSSTVSYYTSIGNGDESNSGEEGLNSGDEESNSGESNLGDEESSLGNGETNSGDGESNSGDGETNSGDMESNSGDEETNSGDVESNSGDLEGYITSTTSIGNNQYTTSYLTSTNFYQASSTTSDHLPSDNYYSLTAVLDELSITYKEMVNTVSVCFNDYGDFLIDSLKDMSDIKSETEALETDSLDVKALDDIESRVNLIHGMYIDDKISKLDLANELLLEGSSNTTSLSNLNDLISAYSNRFEQETIVSTRAQLKSIEESLRDNYDIMVKDFLALAEYMGYTIDGNPIKQLHLFRKPLPSVEDSDFVSFLLTFAQVKRLVGNRPITFLENEGRKLAKKSIEDYFNRLFGDLDELQIAFVEVKGKLVSAVADLKEALQTHKTELALGPSFIRENVMQVDVYFGEIKYFKTEQTIGYSIGDFFSDLGGYLGLLLGASVVTVCEILDLIIYNIAKFHLEKKEKRQRNASEKPRPPSASKWKEPNKIDVFPMSEKCPVT